MEYIGNIIRPPSESRSMIIQVTVGCSHNMCTFCGTYKGVDFRLKDIDVIKRDIDEASGCGFPFERAFLADGDVLSIPASVLIDIISHIKKRNPGIQKVSLYGNTKSILKKDVSELKELAGAGLTGLYHGIESGNEEVLRRIKKGALPRHMIRAAAKVIDAGITLSQTVLLGIGGAELSSRHAADTGKILGEMSPHFASALTVMVLPGTGLHEDFIKGKFVLPDKFQLINELKILIENMEVRRDCYFTSNHASNYLPIKARLPGEKEKALALIHSVIKSGNEGLLKPEYLRAL